MNLIDVQNTFLKNCPSLKVNLFLIEFMFFFTPQTIYGLPAAGGIFLAYVMPAYLLGGLHKDITNDLKHEDFNTFFYYSGKYVENDILIVFTEINS